MKIKEIREMSAADLDKKLAELKEELFNMHFQMATGQCEHPTKVRELKKSIAQIKTIQREAELKA
ncbi:MAG: 50S ribosomal protein L29 [Phascolarctobacterium sp.]|nr:50S ribosomal protein L29 [Candidatus Phascolarctobacterium equi]